MVEGILGFEVPRVVIVAGIVTAAILAIAVAIMFLLDVWSEVRELFDGVKEWWQDRHH